MPESITRPDVNAIAEPSEQHNRLSRPPETAGAVIWTPRFIAVFALLLALGLSQQSLFTLMWSSGYIQAPWVLMAEQLCLTACLIVLICSSSSWWLRAGGIFGCIWTVFSCLNQLLVFVALEPLSPIPAYLNAIFSSALLGSYICLSLERTPRSTWDNCFFGIAACIVVCLTVTLSIVTAVSGGAFSTIESGIAAMEIIFSVLVWWLRPSCWRNQPGPTLLFGLTPALLLLLSLTALGRGQTNFFLGQVAMLTFMLATLRVIQEARRRRQVLEAQAADAAMPRMR
jgi:hypothetical protein